MADELHTYIDSGGRHYIWKDGWVPVPSHILGYNKQGREYLREWGRWVRGERKDEPDLSSHQLG